MGDRTVARPWARAAVACSCAITLSACATVSVGTPPSTTIGPGPSVSSKPLPPSGTLVDAVATRLQEELARVPDHGWAPHVKIVYERAHAALMYAIAVVDDDDVPGAWLAVIATAIGDRWSVVGSSWAGRAGVGASDVNLVGVNAYPYDPVLLGFVGREIVELAIVDPGGTRTEATIVEGAFDLAVPHGGAIVASGDDGLRFALLLTRQGSSRIPGGADSSTPEAGVVTQVARAVVEGRVEEVASQTEPSAQRALRALSHVLEQEGGAWTIVGTPAPFGRVYAVRLDHAGTPFELVLSLVNVDGLPIVRGGQLARS